MRGPKKHACVCVCVCERGRVYQCHAPRQPEQFVCVCVHFFVLGIGCREKHK